LSITRCLAIRLVLVAIGEDDVFSAEPSTAVIQSFAES